LGRKPQFGPARDGFRAAHAPTAGTHLRVGPSRQSLPLLLSCSLWLVAPGCQQRILHARALPGQPRSTAAGASLSAPQRIAASLASLPHRTHLPASSSQPPRDYLSGTCRAVRPVRVGHHRSLLGIKPYARGPSPPLYSRRRGPQTSRIPLSPSLPVRRVRAPPPVNSLGEGGFASARGQEWSQSSKEFVRACNWCRESVWGVNCSPPRQRWVHFRVAPWTAQVSQFLR
jgi:hypothetical protein